MGRYIGFKLVPTARVYSFEKGDQMGFVFQKQPGETYPISIDYSAPGALPDGVTVSSAAVTAYNAQTRAAAPTVLLGSATTTSSSAKVSVTAGTHGTDYNIKFSVTLSDLSVLEEDLIMEVREIGS